MSASSMSREWMTLEADGSNPPPEFFVWLIMLLLLILYLGMQT
jgi:hypothetical protein